PVRTTVAKTAIARSSSRMGETSCFIQRLSNLISQCVNICASTRDAADSLIFTSPGSRPASIETKESVMSVKHVLFIVTNAAVIGPNSRATGFFFPEIAHPFEALDKAGIAVEYASPQGGKPPEDGFDANDPLQAAFLKSASYRRLARSRKLSEV